MKVKLLVSRAVPGTPQNRGDIVDVSESEGSRMIEAGQAEAVRASNAENTSARKATSEKTVK